MIYQGFDYEISLQLVHVMVTSLGFIALRSDYFINRPPGGSVAGWLPDGGAFGGEYRGVSVAAFE